MRLNLRAVRPGLLMQLAAICALLCPGLAAGGQQASAGIVGQVTDENGGVLPGVAVVATSPALQVASATDVTNERGEYRLTPLPVGTYTVEYTPLLNGAADDGIPLQGVGLFGQ